MWLSQQPKYICCWFCSATPSQYAQHRIVFLWMCSCRKQIGSLNRQIRTHLTAFDANLMFSVCMQGSSDHMERLQAQVQTLQANSAQAELAECRTVISQLQQQLEAKQAEVLMLKEREGGSSKAADVIRALENQVHKLTCCCCRQAWSAHLYMFGTATVLRCLSQQTACY